MLRPITLALTSLILITGACDCGGPVPDGGGSADSGAGGNDDAGPDADAGDIDDAGPGPLDGGGHDAGSGGVDAGTDGGASVDGGTPPDGGTDAGDADGGEELPFDAGFASYVPDPEVFAAAPIEANLIELADSPNWTIPGDELVILLEEGADSSVAAEVAQAVGGAVVGQVPSIGMFQIRLGTADLTSLDAAILSARALPGVGYATYNPLSSIDTYEECYPDTDLEALSGDDRCPFELIGVYATAAVLQGTAPPLSRVRVGLVDTGVNGASNAFDAVPILNTDAPGTPTIDNHGHGTQVAGVIAADDDGYGVAGIASTLTGGRVSLVFGRFGTRAEDIAAIHRVAGPGGARVVNMSFGVWVKDPAYGIIDPVAEIEAYRRAFIAHPNVLFVASAGNEPLVLDGTNKAPGGIDLPNLITVSALERCDPAARADFAAYGPGVDIMAAGVDVPAVNPTAGGSIERVDGTSFAAPTVTAVAATVLSVHPGLQGAALKSFLLEHGKSSPNVNLPDRVNAFESVAQAIVDVGTSPAAVGVVDDNGDDDADRQGAILGRVCGGVTYEVSGYGSHHAIDDESQDASVVGLLFGGFEFAATAADTSYFSLMCSSCELQIGASYALDQSQAYAFFIPDDELGSPQGISESGTWTIDRCRVESRFNNGAISSIGVEGTASGVMEMVPMTPDGVPHSASFEAEFSQDLAIATGAMSGPLFDHLEQACEGGLNH